MASPGGSISAAIARRKLEWELQERPFLFEFFQAVRLAERYTGRSPIGRFAQPRSECLRIGSNNITWFPPSQLNEFEWKDEAAPVMRINFMGLTGPLGVLPIYYTQLVAERIRARDNTLRDFFDVFNHRIVSLFYRAWEKYRFAVEYERSGNDQVARRLLDLVGMGTPGLQDRQAVRDHSLIFYSGLLGPHVRCAANLRGLLEDYFGVEVQVVQFAGAWYKLDRGTQCCLERGETTASECLALGAVVGDEIWNEQGRVRIRIGPLSLEQYLDFLPSGTAYEPLRAMTRFYGGDQLDFEVQLVLRRDQVPGVELGAELGVAPRLGWVSWPHTALMGRDPDETILQL